MGSGNVNNFADGVASIHLANAEKHSQCVKH